MNKLIIVIFAFLLIANLSLAQEELVPLEYNSNIRTKSHLVEKEGLIHNKFIYLFDTLSFPFIDDFSENHFPKFDAKITDPNVYDETWFKIEIGGTPVPMGTNYMFDTTYTYQYDTVSGYGFDSIILINKIPHTEQLAEIFNIDVYPVTSQVLKVWPDFNVYDSIWNGTSVGETIFIDFNDVDVFQDSATVYFVSETAADTNVFWQDNYVYHNYTYAENIQTLGVASFDGLDENGYPYDFTSTIAAGEADVLTSKPIDMSSKNIGDSIYFSFIVQPGGLGEAPESSDSLILQFYSPLTGEWATVWRTTGYTSSTFDIQLLPMLNALYLQNGFQFRFKSYGSLTGSLDVWHIDYVYIDEDRHYDDTFIGNLAYTEPSPSFIKNYSAMPWPHYQHDPDYNIKDIITVRTYNSSDVDAIVANTNSAMKEYFRGNIQNILPYQFGTHNAIAFSDLNLSYDLPASGWFDPNLADTCADFEIIQYFSAPTLFETDLLGNDTLRHTQHFSNYYSYDDGSAEAAYGLVSNGAQLAYQYTLSPGLTDTIRAISMHFSPSVHDVSNSLFFLQIWDDYQGEPGNLIYTTDQTVPETYTPQYNIGNNGFYEYVLPEKVAVSGTYYVGWKQSSSDRLNIGFDKNIDNKDKIFYKLSTTWQNTGFEGSLMMRPVFVSDKDILLSVNNNVWDPSISIYPNPASDIVNIKIEDSEISSYELYDMQGKIVLQNFVNDNQATLNVNSLTNGLYIISLRNEQNQAVQKKISIFR